MRALINTNYLVGLLFLVAAPMVGAVEVHSVLRNGRSIQLDGFLLEWKQSDSRFLSKDSLWRYDVINTREGLTGYFASTPHFKCGLWKFRFLPHQLSPHAGMDLIASLDSLRPFYRTAPLSNAPKGGIAAEWIIPWDSIWHDSMGAYQVGLFAFDTCCDTISPLILTGHVYHTDPEPGEKEHEDMLTAEEGMAATRHDRVFVVPGAAVAGTDSLFPLVDELARYADAGDIAGIVRALRALVPTYRPSELMVRRGDVVSPRP